MAYTTIPTLTDTVLSAANFNTYLRDNQLALKNPPSDNFEANQGSDYTRTSSAYADISADFSKTIVTTGGDVVVGLSGTFTSTSSGLIDIAVDGVRIGTGTGVSACSVIQTAPRYISIVRLITGLSAGSHTFSIQWRVTSIGTVTLYAGAGTASYDVHPQFWVRELS